ncbi:hypothetical protein KSO_015980 [Bacillus amyloliquefaciens IT-45]|nr:hypothetical protein KSO_015980 [Bacillus amyloliquefaciens IT-45]
MKKGGLCPLLFCFFASAAKNQSKKAVFIRLRIFQIESRCLKAG